MNDDELEGLVDRALGALPHPRAPRSLAPRVMAAVAARPAPVVPPRTWFTWPLAWQLLSAIVFVVVVGGASWMWPEVSDRVRAVAVGPSASLGSQAAAVSQHVGPWLAAARIVWRGVVAPVAPVVLVLILAMGVMSVTVGAVLRHVAFGGSSS